MEKLPDYGFSCPHSILFEGVEKEHSFTLEEILNDLSNAHLSSNFDQFEHYKVINSSGNFTYRVGVQCSSIDKITFLPANSYALETQFLSK